MGMKDYMSEEAVRLLISSALKMFNVKGLSPKEQVIMEERVSLFLDGLLGMFDVETIQLNELTKLLIYVIIYQLYCITKLEEKIEEQ